MDLTIDARMINRSGIGIYLKNILNRIANEFRIQLLGSANEIINTGININNVKVINIKQKIYSIKEHFEIPIKIKKTILYWSPHYVLPILPIRTKFIITTIHDLNHIVLNNYSLLKKSYANVMIKNATKKSERIITVSNFIKKELIKYTNYPENRINVIYNGVDTSIFRNIKNTNINNFDNQIINKRFILFVGNIKPHKNLFNALQAFKKIIKVYDDLSFVIVGNQKNLITVDLKTFQLIKDDSILRKKVIFTGYIDEKILVHLYNAASLLLFPSIYEGFGLPPLEAMACECPVVASKTASIPEVCGDAVYYIDPNDIDCIANGCIMVLKNSNLKKTLIKNGIKRVKLFSWEEAAKKHIKIFKEYL